jgi:aldose 1-epimerase
MDGQGALTLTYTATTDAPTIVNLTNHIYWNLGGEHAPGDALSALLTIPAAHYLPVDATQIPTGELRPVAATVFDFRAPHPINRRLRDGAEPQLRPGRGYDHCWVIAPAPSPVPILAARVHDQASGRVLEVLADAPGLQFYSGNALDGSIAGKSGRLYRQGDGFALEPQIFPDTPNQPAFGSARLDPGQTYRNRIVYRLTVAKSVAAAFANSV